MSLLTVYERDLTIVRGKGARLYDSGGREYLDFAAGVGVNGLGYGDRKVLAAIKRQAAALIHASNLYHNEPASMLADRLAALTFASRVFFCNSGAEACETAMKFARKVGQAAGRSEFLCFEGAFHGRTLGALSATWKESYRKPFEPLVPGVRFLPWNDLGAVASAIDDRTAAVMLEPVQGEGGVRPASLDFLLGVRELTRERGVLLVLDEVQCGLGRTGRLFAYEHAGITPDILTLAKPLGGGLPMGAALLREDLAPALAVGDHGSTFGGNPVAAAASLAVLERLTAPGFVDGVARRGDQLLRGLRKLARHSEAIAEVRGLGLMIGIEFKDDVGPVVKRLRDVGVLATKAGDRVLRLLPPLVIKPADVRLFLQSLEAALPSERLGGVDRHE